MKQAVILAGGKGTRLKNVSGDLPKPMIPILGKPVLEYIIEQCVKYKIVNIKLLVSYKKDIIEDYFGNGALHGAKIEYIYENAPRGTAGALMDALDELDEKFIVMYGDTFFDIDLESFSKFHHNNDGDASIFLHPNDHPHDSDLVELGSFNRVLKIHSYPHDDQWRQNLVNAAVYIFNRNSLLNMNFFSKKPDIAKDLFPRMLRSKKKLYGYISTEYIKDMGTPDRLSKVEIDINSGKVKSLKKQLPKVAIFLDRDGTINQEVNHLSNIKEFELIEGVGEAIKKINTAGILAVVTTNQPVLARGELKELELKVIHNKMDTLLGRQGAYIDRIYYCPHHPDKGFKGEVKSLKFDCDCRKPEAGLFIHAKNDLNINLEESWVVGDRTSDIMAAHNTGMRSVLVKTGYAGQDGKYDVKPDFIANDLKDAVEKILKVLKK
ncbi:HAD-IIIA family hydrolase [Gammaproteobacteria bacterium]|nr:HAD-IIIA family hydrolase [Gammaproteobacteria bacterium]